MKLLSLFVSAILATATSTRASDVIEYTGHLRSYVSLSDFDSDNLMALESGKNILIDGSADLRLNAILFPTDNLTIELAYESAISGGESRETASGLLPSAALDTRLLQSSPPNDDQQFFSLTGIIKDTDQLIAYHRIDRASLAVTLPYGQFKIGRQALTWGNGILFNPLDLINPFAPTDIIRDYKVGTDMFLYQLSAWYVSDLQLVYVPRRNKETGELDQGVSTFGARGSIPFGNNTFDLTLVSNYGDTVIGTGMNTLLGDAILRTDLSFTNSSGTEDTTSYVSAVANIDYSWTWQDKNWYGQFELYYNGLGHSNPLDALQDPQLVERMLRGEIFVTGTWYLASTLQYEAHPLVNIFATLLCSLGDGSILLQPRVNWDLSQSSQLLAGLDLPIGETDDEFGNISLPESNATYGQPIRAYLLFTWFF